jgi:hypothetical protein
MWNTRNPTRKHDFYPNFHTETRQTISKLLLDNYLKKGEAAVIAA